MKFTKEQIKFIEKVLIRNRHCISYAGQFDLLRKYVIEELKKGKI